MTRSRKKGLRLATITLAILLLISTILIVTLQPTLASEGTVKTLEPLDTAVDEAMGVYDPDEKVLYVIGGYTGSTSNDVQYYDVETNTTGTYTDCLPHTIRTGGADLRNGIVYIFGDYDTHPSDVVAFSLANHTGWVYDTIPVSDLYNCFAVYSPDTDRFYIGGKINGSYSKTIIEYDPVNKTQTFYNDVLPYATGLTTACYDTKRNIIWIVGGYDGSQCTNHIQVFDPVSHAAKNVGTFSRNTANNLVIYDSVNDTLLVFGGNNGTTVDWSNVEDEVVKITLTGSSYSDAGVSSIETVATLPEPAGKLAGGYDSSTNTVYMAGGKDDSATIKNRVWSYDLPDPQLWQSYVTVYGLVGSLHNFTFSGDAGTTVWTNASGGAGGTAQFYISANSTDNFTEFRMWIGDWGPIGASNISVVFSSDNVTWGTNGRSPPNGGGNITINSSLWSTANGCYGANPFPIHNKNVSIYVRLRITIPSDTPPTTATYQNWKWWSRREWT